MLRKNKESSVKAGVNWGQEDKKIYCLEFVHANVVWPSLNDFNYNL